MIAGDTGDIAPLINAAGATFAMGPTDDVTWAKAFLQFFALGRDPLLGYGDHYELNNQTMPLSDLIDTILEQGALAGYFITRSEAETAVKQLLPDVTPIGPSTTAGKSACPPDTGEQLSFQYGLASVAHKYTTAAGPGDPLYEGLLQLVAAYTDQHHGKNQSGVELQQLVQLQYSFQTNQWTASIGGQASDVIQLTDTVQLSFITQFLAGVNASTGATQFQPAAGAQIAVQPKDWFNVGVQLAGSYTQQQGGPSSVDIGPTLFFTFSTSQVHPSGQCP
jgi:hypothetical protein